MRPCAPISYSSEKEAREHLKRMQKEGGSGRVWFCPKCGRFHVDSQKGGRS